MERLIIIRYGELSLKGLNRPYFERSLEKAINSALEPLGAPRVVREHGRMYVSVPRGAAVDGMLSRLQRVFGIVSASPALAVPLDMGAIQHAALLSLREEPFLQLAGAGRPPRPLTFKVDARRANKSFPADSLEVNRRVGAFLLENNPGIQVDVHEPDVTVSIEIRSRAFVYTRTVAGPGGLPPRTSGRALLLLSGGIDSPVAGWLAMKRGLMIDALHFESPPFTSERARLKVEDLGQRLAEWGAFGKMYFCNFTAVQREIYGKCPAPLGVTIMRRFMFRIAEGLARRLGAMALVTGESLGQVASQTLHSLYVINRVCTMPVLRPLIGFDKTEIVERARAIGTYETSILPFEDCCTIFVPRRPSTRPQESQVEAAEAGLDIGRMVAEALDSISTQR